jgi:hypothetical protein
MGAHVETDTPEESVQITRHAPRTLAMHPFEVDAGGAT